jgi:putative sigma-54 modulation protein
MNRKAKAAEFIGEEYEISITGRNVEVTDAMRDYAIEKISKMERFSERIISVHVMMEVQKLLQKVDIIMNVDNIVIKSCAINGDIYASIDEATHKLQTQLVRYKQRIQDHHYKPVKEVDMRVNVIRPLTDAELNEINDEIDFESRERLVKEYGPKQIVATDTKALKQLTCNEAMMKLELSSDPFLLFLCEEDRNLKLIYRRKDGNYGIIEPKI